MKQREKTVPKKKEPKPKKERTPKEATALMLGVVALVLAILAIAAGYFLPVLVGAVLGIAAVIAGFASLMFGKGGLLPALVGIAAGFLNLLAAIVVSKMQSAYFSEYRKNEKRAEAEKLLHAFWLFEMLRFRRS